MKVIKTFNENMKKLAMKTPNKNYVISNHDSHNKNKTKNSIFKSNK